MASGHKIADNILTARTHGAAESVYGAKITHL